MRIDLRLVITPADHFEAGVGRGCSWVSGHALTVPGGPRKAPMTTLRGEAQPPL
jgi:hypothetical protein